MTEITAARDALLGALQVLAAAATPGALRRAVHQLVDEQDAGEIHAAGAGSASDTTALA
jgi:hypothetical protein